MTSSINRSRRWRWPVPGRWGGGAAGDDRGSASIWLLIAGLSLIVLALLVAATGTAAVGRHRARTAADLGALAGARWALWGADVACPEAAAIVHANGGRLTGCRVVGVDLIVGVEVPVMPLPGWTRTAYAEARAGPVRVGPAGAEAASLFTVRDRGAD